jgi:putative membrane protein
MLDMSWKRIVPLASVLTVAAVAFTIRSSVAAPVPPTSAPAHIALDDPTIVAIFDAANTADIETGELGAKMGSTKAIRDFGAMLARDHKVVRQQGRDLAKKLGVTPTPPKDDNSAAEHAQVMTMLRSKQGEEFDRAYLAHEVAFHQAVIDAINKTLLPAIQNPELRDLVVKVGPAFQGHMVAAQTLEKKLAN